MTIFVGQGTTKSLYLKILNPNISFSFKDTGLIFFVCDHNFYRFQNNFSQRGVLWSSFINFQGCVKLTTPRV